MPTPKEYEIETREVEGRSVIIMRLVWPDGAIGYDVYEAIDGKLGDCLTDEESFDDIPTDEEIAGILPLTSAQLVAKAISELADHYTLYYVSRSDDGLSDNQIARIFAGDVEGVESELDEWGMDHVDYNVDEIINDLIPDEDDRDRIDADDLDELRSAIQDRDDSKGAFLEQLGATGSKLMRYYLDFDLEPGSWSWEEPQIEEAMAAMAEAAGIDLEANRDHLYHLVVEASYGGGLYVIWYGDPEDVVLPVVNAKWGNEDKVPTTISWTNPELVVLDQWNGSGYGDDVVGTVTKPFDPTKLAMDGEARGHGYTWDQVAGVVYSCFDSTPSFTYPTKEG